MPETPAKSLPQSAVSGASDNRHGSVFWDNPGLRNLGAMSKELTDLFEGMLRGCPSKREFIGLALSDAEQLASTNPAMKTVRVWDDPHQGSGPRMMTADARPARLNLLIEDGVVVAAVMG